VSRLQKVIRAEDHDARVRGCWDTSVEHHADYDLYSVEFDDQGWLAGTPSKNVPDQTQLSQLMADLNKLTRGRGDPDARPLSVIVYTHGWHHTAAPDDSNVIAFRRLLARASVVERELCLSRRRGGATALEEAPAKDCSENEAVEVWKRKRRVVGVYVGWRGDSVEGPLIEDLSIWDRKLAAESVALGSVQEFFARLHSFYVEHECHTSAKNETESRALENCADVRMLTVGHSFGGLITYRALAPRLMLGISETAPDEFNPSLRYAYGFGDLTILINPAFEATRFEPLAEAAAARPYLTPASGKSAQLPILIVATSKTDRATGVAFPTFRWFTTLFETTQGPEGRANLETVGWDSRYRTHSLQLLTTPDSCGTTKQTPLSQRLLAEAHWADQQRDARYAGFGAKTLELCDSLRLSQEPGWALNRPDFLPLWVIQADKEVIDGHNDFLDTNFVNFVRQVYYTILAEEDIVMRQRISKAPSQAAPPR
jgi:hypothetical protein